MSARPRSIAPDPAAMPYSTAARNPSAPRESGRDSSRDDVRGVRVRMHVARHAPGRIDFDQQVRQTRLIKDSRPQHPFDAILGTGLRDENQWRSPAGGGEPDRGAKHLASHRNALFDG